MSGKYSNNKSKLVLTVVESPLLLHKRNQRLTGFRYEEHLLLSPLRGEFGSPYSFEVGRVG